MLSIASCKKETVHSPLTSLSDSLVLFQGLPVKHTFNNPENVLNFNEMDFQKMFLKELNRRKVIKNTIKSLAEAPYLSLEELAAIEEKNKESYPNFSNLDSVEFSKIKINFPTLTDQQIADNIELIEQYYTKNLQYDVLLDVINLDGGAQSNTSGYYGDLSSEEFWYFCFGGLLRHRVLTKQKRKHFNMR